MAMKVRVTRHVGACEMFVEGIDLPCFLCGTLVRSGERHSCRKLETAKPTRKRRRPAGPSPAPAPGPADVRHPKPWRIAPVVGGLEVVIDNNDERVFTGTPNEVKAFYRDEHDASADAQDPQE